MGTRQFKQKYPQFDFISDNGGHYTAYLKRGYAFRNPGTDNAEHSASFPTIREVVAANYYDCSCRRCQPQN
ncbi:MAG: hypothetical protein SAqTSB_38530 [Shewanella algae]